MIITNLHFRIVRLLLVVTKVNNFIIASLKGRLYNTGEYRIYNPQTLIIAPSLYLNVTARANAIDPCVSIVYL